MMFTWRRSHFLMVYALGWMGPLPQENGERLQCDEVRP